LAWVVLAASACIDAPLFVGGGGAGGAGGATTSNASSASGSSSVATSSTSSGEGGCDADLTTSSEHCGACFHACDGPCDKAVCQPVLLATTLSEPRGIAVDDEYVYWVNHAGAVMGAGDVRRMRKLDGSEQTVLAPNQFGPWDLELSEGYLYWTNRAGDSIGRVKADGSEAPSLIATSVLGPTDLVVGDQVYFVASTQGTIFAVDKTGMADPVPLVVGLQNPEAITLGGNELFFTDATTGDVHRVPVTGGAASLFYDAAAAPAFQIAVTPSNAVWCAFGERAIRYQAFGSTTSSVIGDGTECWGVFTEGERVYWTQEFYGDGPVGTVMSAEADGTGLVGHATDQVGPTGIATDAAAIYWTSFIGGQVFRVNK